MQAAYKTPLPWTYGVPPTAEVVSSRVQRRKVRFKDRWTKASLDHGSFLNLFQLFGRWASHGAEFIDMKKVGLVLIEAECSSQRFENLSV